MKKGTFLALAMMVTVAAFGQDPLSASREAQYNKGITVKDTLKIKTKHLQVKTKSGTAVMTADSAQMTVNSGKLYMGASTAPFIRTGTGTPLYVVKAPVGSIYIRTNGVLDSAIYIKHTGTDSAGWWPVVHN